MDLSLGLGIIGILVTILYTLIYYRRQKKDSEGSKKELNDKIEDLKEKLSPVKTTSSPSRKEFASNIPTSVDDAPFFGREAQLKKLFEKLIKQKKETAITQVSLAGMGGAGKTRLAQEFANEYRHPHFPGGTFKVVAKTDDGLSAEMSNLTDILGRDYRSFENDQKRIKFVRMELGSGKTSLLIFDNLVEGCNYRNFLPMGDNCRILVTSRIAKLPHLTEIDLPTLSDTEAYDLLTYKIKPDSPEEKDAAKEICKKLGYYPLAIELASFYVYEKKDIFDKPFKTYLERIEKNGGLAQLEKTKAELEKRYSNIPFTDHDVSVYATLKENVESIKDTDNALKLLNIISMFDETLPIPHKLLKKALDVEEEKFVEALSALFNYSLIKNAEIDVEGVEGKHILIHSLLAEFIRMEMSEEENKNYEIDFITLIKNYIGLGEADRLAYYQEINYELPHIQKAERLSQKNKNNIPETVADLFIYIGLVYIDKGELDNALQFYQQALSIDEKVSGRDHPKVARDVNYIGLVYYNKGELDKALKFLLRSLEIDEKIFGKDHKKIATYVNNIGLVYKKKGELDKALEFFLRALRIDEKTFGKDHPKVASSNNIGLVYKDKGELDKALKVLLQALEISEKVFGKEHPKVAGRVNNIGEIYQDKGELDKALEFYQRALAIDEKIFGREHPKVAIRVNNIGRAYQNKGEKAKARDCFKRAYLIWHKFLVPEHKNTNDALHNYFKCGGTKEELMK